MKRALTVIAITLPVLAHAADYKAGWTAARFYPEVVGCENAVVLPAIQSYEKKGLAAGRSEEALRPEVLAMTPVFEHVASSVCFCVMNQLAEDVSYDAFAANRAMLRGYMQSETCRAQAAPTMTRERAEELRLK